MPFWKKMFNKQQAVYYPRAIVQGKPVETETIHSKHQRRTSRAGRHRRRDAHPHYEEDKPSIFVRIRRGKTKIKRATAFDEFLME